MKKPPREPDDVLDPITTSADDAPLAYTVSGTAAFGMRGVAHDGGDIADSVRAVMVDYAGNIGEWPRFVRELFGRLYDPDGCSRLPPEQAMAWAVGAASAAEAQADWDTLAHAARVSRSVAATATVAIAAGVAAALGLNAKKAPGEATADPREALEEAERAAAQAEEEGDVEGAEQIRMEAQRATAEAVGLRKSLDTKMQAARHRLGTIVKQAAAQAAADVALGTALRSLGFAREGAGSLQQVAPGLAAKLKVDARLLKILLRAGRMREAAYGAKAKTDGAVDVVGIRPTGDVSKTTSAWRSRFATPGVVGTMALVEILDGGAQGYEMRDRKPMAHGDLAILQDRSGSMTGERELQARAISVALLMAAVADRRRVVACSFAGTGDQRIGAAIPGDLPSIAKALELLCVSAEGGTDVDDAVVKVAAVMSKLPGGMRSPDIVITTDGVFDPLKKTTLDAAGDRRLFGVLVGVPASHITAHPEFHKMWCADGVNDPVAGAVIASVREGRERR